MVCLPSQCIGAASVTNDAFDINEAIKGLLADPDRDSLELPRCLTSEQRKHAKKAFEDHDGLKCESFGLGADRQMIVFKRPSAEKQPNNSIRASPGCSPVRVKNTFIDDFIPADAAPADRRIVQSMPHNMFGQCLSAELSDIAKSIVDEGSCADSLPANEVVVSTGPFLAEAPVPEEPSFALGSHVFIDGLLKAPAFNGALAVVQSWDADIGRYNVMLAFPTANGTRMAKIKGENLRVAEAPSCDPWNGVIQSR